MFKVAVSPGVSDTETGTITSDANGNMGPLAVVDLFHSAGSQTCRYSYDDLNRLYLDDCGLSVWRAHYYFDIFGNIGKNRFSCLASGTPTYDGNGNLTYDGFHSYGRDTEGNLITMDGITGTFDALDRRVELGSTAKYNQMLYPPYDPTYQMGLASGLTANGIRIRMPGQGEACFVGSGLNSYRRSNWQRSEPPLTWPTPQTPSYGGSFTPFGERYDTYTSGCRSTSRGWWGSGTRRL